MEYRFEYIKSKVLQALRLHFVSRPEVKILVYAVNIFAILALILFWMGKIRPQVFLMCSLLWIAIMIVFWFMMPNIIYRKAIRTFQDKYKAAFNTQGIILENDKGSVHWDWQRFSNYFESDGFFHLYFNPRSFFLFPKEQMNDELISDLRALLGEKLRNAKY